MNRIICGSIHLAGGPAGRSRHASKTAAALPDRMAPAIRQTSRKKYARPLCEREYASLSRRRAPAQTGRNSELLHPERPEVVPALSQCGVLGLLGSFCLSGNRAVFHGVTKSTEGVTGRMCG